MRGPADGAREGQDQRKAEEMGALPLHRRAHSPAPLAPRPRAGRALLTLFGLFALGASGTSRASDAARIEVQFVVPPLQRLRAETEVVSLPPVTTEDVLAGHIDLPRPVQLLLFSNCPWELRLRAAGQTRGSTADATIGPGLWWSCLLYTSPSPRDRTRSRMPSSA